MSSDNQQIVQKQKVVVVGNGMVGHHFVEQLTQLKTDKQPIEITVLSAEPHLAYDRVHLSEYFSGKTAEDLALTDEKTYQDWGVNFLTNSKVVDIDRKKKNVVTENGQVIDYDKLILATGSYPFVPPIPGKDREHCLVYRTINDLDDIQASANISKVGVVIGGGLLGLEAANALTHLGLKTHVVEFAPQLMGVQIDTGGGRLLRKKIEALGVEVHTSKATSVIEDGEQCRYKLCFSDDTVLETDLILFSAGIRPYDNLARTFNLALGERGGIVINNQCQTSAENIYPIGECALWNNFIFGLVAPGYTMAKVAAKHLMGEQASFTGADMSTKLKLMGVEVGSIGDAHAKIPDALTYIYENQPEGIYKKIVISSDKSKMLGAVLIGDTSEYDTLLQYMLNAIDLPESPEALILPSSDIKPSLDTNSLPNTAVICSCHNVTKGDIISAIDQGACSLNDIKTCTKASSGCGGCADLLQNVTEVALQNCNVKAKEVICEHFAHSRHEMFDLISVEKIKTFDELLISHGKGDGCEICKSVANSIITLILNNYIIKAPNVSLQEINKAPLDTK